MEKTLETFRTTEAGVIPAAGTADLFRVRTHAGHLVPPAPCLLCACLSPRSRAPVLPLQLTKDVPADVAFAGPGVAAVEAHRDAKDKYVRASSVRAARFSLPLVACSVVLRPVVNPGGVFVSCVCLLLTFSLRLRW